MPFETEKVYVIPEDTIVFNDTPTGKSGSGTDFRKFNPQKWERLAITRAGPNSGSGLRINIYFLQMKEKSACPPLGKEWKKYDGESNSIIGSGLWIDCKKKTYWADSKLCSAKDARDWAGQFYTGQYPCPTEACPTYDNPGKAIFATWTRKTTRIVFNSELSIMARVNFPKISNPNLDVTKGWWSNLN